MVGPAAAARGPLGAGAGGTVDGGAGVGGAVVGGGAVVTGAIGAGVVGGAVVVGVDVGAGVVGSTWAAIGAAVIASTPAATASPPRTRPRPARRISTPPMSASVRKSTGNGRRAVTGRVGRVTRRLPPTRQDLIRWSEALSGIARTGLGFTRSLYERERFDEVMAVAGDIRAAAEADEEFDAEHYVEEWMKGVGEGVAGYITPKVAVGAVVYNDDGEILLVQRADSGIWLYPTGWADVGYSASEIAVKEVHEETGIECEPVRLIALLDGLRLGFTQVPLYSLVFLCRATGGALTAHPLETRDAGWFPRDAMPQPLAGAQQWLAHAGRAIDGEDVGVLYDEPRTRPWASGG
jgi:ADP-ribose pyrophosphatase YjhB (NUDIX family)